MKLISVREEIKILLHVSVIIGSLSSLEIEPEVAILRTLKTNLRLRLKGFVYWAL
jgi:hypothetical protein